MAETTDVILGLYYNPHSKHPFLVRSKNAALSLQTNISTVHRMVSGTKTHEFRKYLLPASVKRIWFFSVEPPSSHLKEFPGAAEKYNIIEYVCEIEPAVTRGEGEWELPEDGAGNREFNKCQEGWDMYEYAYRVAGVWKLEQSLGLEELRGNGIEGPVGKGRGSDVPRSLVDVVRKNMVKVK